MSNFVDTSNQASKVNPARQIPLVPLPHKIQIPSRGSFSYRLRGNCYSRCMMDDVLRHLDYRTAGWFCRHSIMRYI